MSDSSISKSFYNDENKCPICQNYAEFFIRDYGSCFAVYHANHCCQCGHLHKNGEIECEGKCGCTVFISQEGKPALKTEGAT